MPLKIRRGVGVISKVGYFFAVPDEFKIKSFIVLT